MKIVAGTLLLTVAAFLFDSVETSEEHTIPDLQRYGSSKSSASEGSFGSTRYSSADDSSRAVSGELQPARARSTLFPSLQVLRILERRPSSEDSLFATSRRTVMPSGDLNSQFQQLSVRQPQSSHRLDQVNDDLSTRPIEDYQRPSPYINARAEYERLDHAFQNYPYKHHGSHAENPHVYYPEHDHTRGYHASMPENQIPSHPLPPEMPSMSYYGYQPIHYDQAYISQEPRPSKKLSKNQKNKGSQTSKSFKDSESSHGSGSYSDS